MEYTIIKGGIVLLLWLSVVLSFKHTMEYLSYNHYAAKLILLTLQLTLAISFTFHYIG